MFKSLDELFKEYPWKTYNKFKSLANRHGFTNTSEIRNFLNNKATHDKKLEKPNYLPIFSEEPDSYQFDTLIQSKGMMPFLIFINVNTRELYAFPMKNKSSSEVLKALNEFKKRVKTINFLTSDQDSAYLSNEVLKFMNSNNIKYRTTEDENHNVLGIINRAIRTLRDLNNERDFTETSIDKIISEYNKSPHSSINKSPDEMNEKDEIEYIADKNTETLSIQSKNDLNIGDHVRVVLDKKSIGKNRTNLSMYAYIIDDYDGNNFLVKSKDGSVESYPAYKLVKCDNRYRIANTIKNGKRGVIEKIISYSEKKDKYQVLYDEGSKDFIPSKNLREGNPSKLSKMEREYWSGKSKIPIKIRQWF